MVGVQEFLTQRVAEAWRIQRRTIECLDVLPAAPPDGGRDDGRSVYNVNADCQHVLALRVEGSPAIRDFVTSWDPERARAVLEMVAEVLEEHRTTEGPSCQRCTQEGPDGQPLSVAWPCATVTALTWIWAVHPDWDPEWGER